MAIASNRNGEGKNLVEKAKSKYTLNKHFSETVNELKNLRNDIILGEDTTQNVELNSTIPNANIKTSMVKMDKLEDVSRRFQDKMNTGKKTARTGLGAKSEFFKEEATTFNKIVKDFNAEMTQFSHGTINEQYKPTILLNDMVKFMANFNDSKVKQDETTNKLSIKESLKVEQSSMLMRFGSFYRSWTKKAVMNLHLSQVSKLSLKTKKKSEVKPRQQISKTITRAKEISKEDLVNTEEETSHRIQQISRILSKYKGEPFNLYRICLDPTSYAKTVENLFHVSFLVKSGFMEMFEGEDGWPYLVLLDDDKKNELKKSKKSLIHVTVSMSIETYTNLIEYLEIDKTFLED
ncbi:uncharacterized protein HGUI_02471 [Hanseniaspora guilliermondii]|uniref:Non-structural maintenance of chromosomes element 4 n=1 Tax=Hanseniaspora guilliermondii TaxID=56406 RepID=A0A1L0CZH2_9ASCO|nr:uncharacterized protein HGUI_02471 [Hanseniaspora guilliermondii]